MNEQKSLLPKSQLRLMKQSPTAEIVNAADNSVSVDESQVLDKLDNVLLYSGKNTSMT